LLKYITIQLEQKECNFKQKIIKFNQKKTNWDQKINQKKDHFRRSFTRNESFTRLESIDPRIDVTTKPNMQNGFRFDETRG
jgi:hypothetical protein